MPLLRDGAVLGSASGGEPGSLTVATVRPGAATYRLEATAKRFQHSVATEVSANWTFRWDWAEGLTVNPRLWTARFHPVLDADNRLIKRPVLKLPLTLDKQRDSGPAKLATPARVVVDRRREDVAAREGPGCRRVVLGGAPPGRERRTLSLRVAVEDNQGSSLDQTVKSAFIFR